MQGEETPLKGELKVNIAAEMGSDSQQKGKGRKAKCRKAFFFFFSEKQKLSATFPRAL